MLPSLCAVVFASLAPSVSGQGTALSLSDVQRTIILAKHNDARNDVAAGTFVNTRGDTQPAASNMNRLVWDPALEQTAIGIAETCNFAHTGTNINDLPPGVATFETASTFIGENLAQSSSNPDFSVVEDLVDLWVEERDYYDFSAVPAGGATPTPTECDAQDFLPTNGCGHYTQIIWADTRYVGCGYAFCPGSFPTFLVCLYYTAGNFETQTPYDQGVCGDCDSDRDQTCDNTVANEEFLCSGALATGFYAGDASNLQCDDGAGNTISTACGSGAPTESPVTASPTPDPTTAEPTTAIPTEAPTTGAPSMPPTQNPTGAPTLPTSGPTQAPTTPPTETQLSDAQQALADCLSQTLSQSVIDNLFSSNLSNDQILDLLDLVGVDHDCDEFGDDADDAADDETNDSVTVVVDDASVSSQASADSSDSSDSSGSSS